MEGKPLPEPDEISSFYIQATASIQERWPRTLKHGDTFSLCDQLGDVHKPDLTPGGLFHEDTRYLSEWRLLLDGQRPLLLSSTIDDDNVVLTVDLSNPDIYRDGQIVLPRETLHVRRSRFLWEGCAYERIAVHNFDSRPQKCWLTLSFDADFADLFEIRGLVRPKRGVTSIERPNNGNIQFRNLGVDGVVRVADICFSPAPQRLEENSAVYAFVLEPHQQVSISITVRCAPHAIVADEPFSIPYRAARRQARCMRSQGGLVSSSNELVDRMLKRATSDFCMLITETAEGPYPYAGTPWFNTPFGRDGIITALQMLWLDSSVAKGVLRFLAATQATKIDPAADAQPGKILHETRKSEMALLQEVPFGKYYGSVDSTPLFVLLAARYFERTGDLQTMRALWPNIEAALDWIDTYGDIDRDGFVEYQRESSNGLVNQGWKDSQDSIMHADGTLAEGSVALCEVQGYVFAGKKGAAGIARALGEDARADALEAEAEALRIAFEEKFWCEEIGMYALALDGKKNPCRVQSSNAGQVLFTRIASQERAARVAETLLTPECFSGWGIRTLGASAARYNPMSYHNGSIWPHDNALIALGMGTYGFRRAAGLIFIGMFEAACHMDLMRIPELFCGFPKRRGTAPTLYPVACQPQAWASVVPFALLEACLGITCDYAAREIRFEKPYLPRFLEELRIDNLHLAEGSVNLHIRRQNGEVVIGTAGHASGIGIRVLK